MKSILNTHRQSEREKEKKSETETDAQPYRNVSIRPFDTVNQMNDDKSYLLLDLDGILYINVMHFKCLAFVALMALCKQHATTMRRTLSKKKMALNFK